MNPRRIVPVAPLFLAACTSTGAVTEREMAGAWTGPEAGTVLYFDGERAVMADDGTQVLFDIEYGDGVAARTVVYNGQSVPGILVLDADALVVVDPMKETEARLQRTEGVPEAVRLEPLVLGTRVPDDAERARIAGDLARRATRDQAVRTRMQARTMKEVAEGRIQSSDDRMRFMASAEMTAIRDDMIAIDRDNTRRLTELLVDVGWISRDAFGTEAHDAAFLIAQHSSNLRLMRTVLPLIEAEAREDPAVGQLYALLYDRTELALGRDQRYGTQLLPGSDGGLVLGRVESFKKLDDRRAEMGLMPIDDYLARFEQEFGEIEIER
jgi:hypothetical protein